MIADEDVFEVIGGAQGFEGDVIFGCELDDVDNEDGCVVVAVEDVGCTIITKIYQTDYNHR